MQRHVAVGLGEERGHLRGLQGRVDDRHVVTVADDVPQTVAELGAEAGVGRLEH